MSIWMYITLIHRKKNALCQTFVWSFELYSFYLRLNGNSVQNEKVKNLFAKSIKNQST